MSKMDTKDFAIGAIIGGIVGASAAMLLAPKSGSELRSDINDKATVAKDLTVEFSSVAKEKGTEYSQFAKEKSDEWTQLAKEKSENISKLAKDSWERVADKTTSVTDKASEMGDDLASDVRDIMETEKTEGKKLADQVVKEIEDTKERIQNDVGELKGNEKKEQK